MRRLVSWFIGIAAAGAVICVFPLFHVVSLESAREQKAEGMFDPATFVKSFWDDRLMKSLDQAADAGELLRLLQSDPAAARKQFGRSLGIGGSQTYFLSGKGRVMTVTSEGVGLGLSESSTEPEVVLETGLLFGNTVRDATGLLNVSDFPNSQDFNGISAELNRIIETRIQPQLKKLADSGSTLRFVGCARVNDESTDLRPLRVVPVQVQAAP